MWFESNRIFSRNIRREAAYLGIRGEVPPLASLYIITPCSFLPKPEKVQSKNGIRPGTNSDTDSITQISESIPTG
jgi:hypothetical protein